MEIANWVWFFDVKEEWKRGAETWKHRMWTNCWGKGNGNVCKGNKGKKAKANLFCYSCFQTRAIRIQCQHT